MKLILSQGAYESKSIISDAQRCINLYQEKNPEDSPFPLTHYLTPGLDILSSGSSLSNINLVRCTFRTSAGDLYVCIGTAIYFVDPAFVFTSVGTIDAGTSKVSMQDNGLVILIGDGTANLYAIDISTTGIAGAFSQVTDPNIYGANTIDYLDTFFLLNVPNTNEWYISLSEVNFAMLTGVAGSILGGGITDAGTGYTNGSYPATSLTGGTGSGSVATITVAGNIVTDVVITTPGIGYVVGDVLSAFVTGGSGFTWGVATVGGNAFDPLDIATKDGYPDPIVGLVVFHREILLIGQLTSEFWYNAGTPDFPFQILPGTFVEHGCIAIDSICHQDLAAYWISQDEQGQAIVIKAASYQAKRISTFAIEQALSTYNKVSDCIGFTYQQEGHTFVVFSFPSANVTWVYDETMQLWHQRCWTDNNGNLNRHRMSLGCNAYNANIVGDWQNGNLYKLNLQTYVDNIDGLGTNPDGSYPISRIRSFPAMVDEGKRVNFKSFTVDMQVGSSPNNSNVISDTWDVPGEIWDVPGDTWDAITPFASFPMVSLRYSDDRGRTYGNKIEQSLGTQGNYLTQPKWWRLGQSRGRVFELSWSIGSVTALNGAYIEVEPAGT